MTYYPSTHNKVNSFMSQISAEESEQFYKDEKDYEDQELRELIEDQRRADVEDEDLPNDEPEIDGERDFGNAWENGGREQAAYYQSIK